MFKSAISTTPTFGDVIKYKTARIMPLGEKVQIIIGSEEKIFGEDYVSGLRQNRLQKFRQTAVEYLND